MKTAFPLMAALVLAGCAQDNNAGDADPADIAEEAAVVLAADGKPFVGTFEAAKKDGSVLTLTTTDAGTATYLEETGETWSGTFTYDEQEQKYCFDGEGEDHDYCSYHIFEDGVYTVGHKEDQEKRVVLTRIE